MASSSRKHRTQVSACRIQTQLPAILLFLAVTLGRPPPSAAHVYLTVPPTRAKCYLDQRMGLETDELFRGNPCGRPSRGVLGALVAGTDSCVTARMPVAHPGHFRISIAPGTAGTGGTAEGRPAFATAFDSPGNILAAFDCSSLPGGCPTDAIEGQGDYTFPIRVPANLTAGVYTLQLRQYASEFDWYYYDCADVQVFPSLAAVPAELRASALAATRQCSATFAQVDYMFVAYILTPIMFAPFGILGLLFLLFDLAYVARAHWLAQSGAGSAAAAVGGDAEAPAPGAAAEGPGVKDGSTGKASASAVVLTKAAGAGSAAQQPPSFVGRLCCCCCCGWGQYRWAGFGGTAKAVARRKWPWLAAQAAVVICGYAAVIAVDVTWRTCQFKPNPVFGP